MVKLVVFYEKPFCAANAKQKQILRSSGCILIERNLLEHGLDAEALRSFMGDYEVADWFNPAAPAIKNGEISPETLDETTALMLFVNFIRSIREKFNSLSFLSRYWNIWKIVSVLNQKI